MVFTQQNRRTIGQKNNAGILAVFMHSLLRNG
jgi:hypothetical protein